MAGKFLGRGAIIDTIKGENRANAIRKRKGLSSRPFRVTSCGCPDPNCGAWHAIIMERKSPTAIRCDELLAENHKVRKTLQKRVRA